jgi:lipopolysaccharide/colanic/teichoic acid biosynthesis glycosyltransferase
LSVPAYSDTSRLVENIRVRTIKYNRIIAIDEGLRRLFDIIFSSCCLLLLAPLFTVVAILIRLDSPGPALFIQTRVGRDGRLFPVFKFRSMVSNAEARRKELADANEASGPLFKIRTDPRITKVGKWLRRSSVDELPQLINVLRGEMSLVGPRPALPDEVAKYSAHERERLSVTPGLTGLWQVSGRSDLSFDRAMALDLEYVAKRTIVYDLFILARTIPAVLSGRGAY